MSIHSSDKGGATVEIGDPKFLKVEDIDYVEEKGGNGGLSYQIATGAPVEAFNPLGYNVGFWTALMMNVGQTIGTGIFSTPSNILNGTGSVGMALIYWVIGLIVTLAGVSVYLELASFFPSRSGAEVVYLEQAFHRPKFFFPITFAVYSVLLSFNSGNSLVLAQYIFRVAGRKGGEWEQKGIAIAGITIVSIGESCLRGRLTQSHHPPHQPLAQARQHRWHDQAAHPRVHYYHRVCSSRRPHACREPDSQLPQCVRGHLERRLRGVKCPRQYHLLV